MSSSDDFLNDLRMELGKSLTTRLPEHGVPASRSLVDAVALEVAVDIHYAWAGQQLYVQTSSNHIRKRIYEEFKGDNIRELVSKYRLSTKTIYNILAAERKRATPGQASLPGMEEE